MDRDLHSIMKRVLDACCGSRMFYFDKDNTFKIVVFDPPHLLHAGARSWLAQKYGILPKEWKAYLKAGFQECMRVLETNGILVFKWNDDQIQFSEVLKVFGKKPLLGDKRGKTRWVIFFI